jgi:hypothetical protein
MFNLEPGCSILVDQASTLVKDFLPFNMTGRAV